jgi:hypothetical protein
VGLQHAVHERAVALFEQGRGHPRYNRSIDDHLRALVTLKRTPEAIALAVRYLDVEGPDHAHAALVYNQIARLPDAGPLPAPPISYVEKLAAKPDGKGLTEIALATVGQTPPSLDQSENKTLVSVVRIMLAAGTDPEQAWKLCSEAPNVVLEQLPPTVGILLAAELWRAGDTALADRILWGRVDLPFPPSVVLDFLRTGSEDRELWRMDPEQKAALDLVRARAMDAAGNDVAASYGYSHMAIHDVFQSVVTRARRSWPSLAKTPAAPGGSKPPKR